MSSENFLQAYKRLQYMKQYTNYRKQQGDEIKVRTEELQELNADLADQKEAKDALIAENRQTRTQLEKNKKAFQRAAMAALGLSKLSIGASKRKAEREAEEMRRRLGRAGTPPVGTSSSLSSSSPSS